MQWHVVELAIALHAAASNGLRKLLICTVVLQLASAILDPMHDNAANAVDQHHDPSGVPLQNSWLLTYLLPAVTAQNTSFRCHNMLSRPLLLY